MSSTPRILGVDFTCSPRTAKPIVAAWAELDGDVLSLHDVERLPNWAGFEALLQRPGPWLGAFDFPFGLPRELVRDLDWPQEWAELVRHCSRYDRASFRAVIDDYRATRRPGNKFAHRATDAPAGSSSPMKLVNPPVALMFHEGAPRLLHAGVTLPLLCAGDPNRIALEGYPGLLARHIARNSYKNDTRRLQTPERRAARTRIVDTLLAGRTALGLRLECSGSQRSALIEDASGDSLDAVLCALQAAWSAVRRTENYGLPHEVDRVDRIEGWIATAGVVKACERESSSE